MMCRTYTVNGRREGLPSHEMLRQAMREENSGKAWRGKADVVGELGTDRAHF